MSLICKGTRVSFTSTAGSRVSVPRGAVILHDGSGRAWPKCSVLLMRFEASEERITKTEEAELWLGEGYEARKGRVELPPRALSAWREVARVKMIYYTRTGIAHPGPYKHPFGVTRKLFFRGELPTVYRFGAGDGAAMRLELQDGCIVDRRGFVWP